MPDHVISFAVSNQNTGHVTKKGKNIWVPVSLYWQEREKISLPYFPFFSNCKGYGRMIPVWALTESNFICE